MRNTLSIIFIVIFCCLLKSQDVILKDNQRPESEITATINPIASNYQIVAAINDFDPGVGTQNSRLSIYYSDDFGSSWTKSDFLGLPEITGGINFIGDPVLSYDIQGVAYLVYVAWEQENGLLNTQIHVAQSVNNGNHWATSSVIESTEKVYDKPWITTDISTSSPYEHSVYLTYVEGKTTLTGSDFDLKIQTKRRDETVFSQGITINSIDFEIVQYPNIFVNSQGQVFVSFVGNDGQSTSLYIAKSDNGGVNFQPEVKIANLRMYFSNFSVLGTIVNREGLDRLYPCPQLAIDNTNSEFRDRIYLTWTDKEANPVHYGLDVYLLYSSDGGQNWSNPKIIHQTTNPFIHQYYSSIGIAKNGVVLLAWYDRSEDERNVKTDYFYTKSTDGGQSFIGDKKLTSKSADFAKIGKKNSQFGIGEYTQLVSWGNKSRFFWADGRRNNGDIKIFTSKVKVDESTQVEEKAVQPSITIHPNPTQNELKINGINTTESIKIKILTVDGKIILSENYKTFVDHQSIDIQSITPGIYFLHIEKVGQVIVKKFIKTK